MSNSWTIGPRGAGSAAAGSTAFARCGGYEKALDFTRPGHRIVRLTVLRSFFLLHRSIGAYRRGRLFDGHILVEQDTLK